MGIESWQDLCTVRDVKTHVVPALWRWDRYPETPLLTAGARVNVLDVGGPGVVTHLHSADFNAPHFEAGTVLGREIILRIYYDGESTASITMPFYDFLASVRRGGYFQSYYFSRAKPGGYCPGMGSLNFRLPIPFRRHLRLELHNPTPYDCDGYVQTQWDEVSRIPESCGYLRVDTQEGSVRIPQEKAVLMDVAGSGRIVAHWLDLEADHPDCAFGELLCEGNQEIYLDGELEPRVEFLSTEDPYGFAWGLAADNADFYSVMLRHERTPHGGASLAMLRNRTTDAITFHTACRWVLNYQYEKNGRVLRARDRGGLPLQFRSCVYYYAPFHTEASNKREAADA